MTSGQRVVLILLVASLLAGVITGSVFYYRLAYLWLFLYVGSWILSRLALRGVTLKRTARSLRSQVGQIFEERFEVQNQQAACRACGWRCGITLPCPARGARRCSA